MTSLNQPTGERYSINDIEEEDSPHVYIRNRGSVSTKQPSHLLIPYTSRQTGQQKTIEVPMTRIPFDLADYCPKEELLRNPDLRGAWNSRLIEFVPTDDALRELDTPDAREELDRLFAARTAPRVQPSDDQPNQQQQEALNRAQLEQLPTPQPGQIETATENVSGAVVACMEDRESTPAQRLGLLRNMADILTETDKRYIRSKTDDPKIRQLVG